MVSPMLTKEPVNVVANYALANHQKWTMTHYTKSYESISPYIIMYVYICINFIGSCLSNLLPLQCCQQSRDYENNIIVGPTGHAFLIVIYTMCTIFIKKDHISYET